jgi:hypothetical protein
MTDATSIAALLERIRQKAWEEGYTVGASDNALYDEGYAAAVRELAAAAGETLTEPEPKANPQTETEMPATAQRRRGRFTLTPQRRHAIAVIERHPDGIGVRQALREGELKSDSLLYRLARAGHIQWIAGKFYPLNAESPTRRPGTDGELTGGQMRALEYVQTNQGTTFSSAAKDRIWSTDLAELARRGILRREGAPAQFYLIEGAQYG